MTQTQAQPGKSILPPAAAMLMASVLLGLAYNSASPLGVRTAGASDKPPAAVPGVAGSQSGYANQTISVALSGTAAARPSGTAYENQTLAIGLAPVQAAPTPVAPTAVPSFPHLTWPQTQALIADGRHVLVDARATNYFQAEHIPGAVSLPSYSPPVDIAAFAAKFPKSTPLVIYCGSVSCPMAQQLAEALRNQGYADIKVMPGGFAEYRIAQSQPPGGAK